MIRSNSIYAVAGLLFISLLSTASDYLIAEDKYFETEIELKKPKKDSSRSREGGLEHVPFRIWLPEGVKTIRGVVFNPMYTDAVTQQHWQAAGRHWEFGILASNFFGAKSEEFPNAIDTALATFAEESGHPELIGAKMCLVGMSAGAGNCTRIAELMPERTIAMGPVCLEVGPRNTASMAIPTITVFGERDGKQYEILTSKLPEVREQAGLFAIAVQWRRKHEFGQANNLLIPLFDAAIRQRLEEPGKPLIPFTEESGWLGDLSTWKEGVTVVAGYDEFQGDKSLACWFPDESTARTWQAFVTRQPELKLANPPGLGDKQPLVLHRAGAEIEIKVAGSPSLDAPIEVYAGAEKLGELTDGSLFVKISEPGFYPLYLQASSGNGKVLRSRPSTIIVQ